MLETRLLRAAALTMAFVLLDAHSRAAQLEPPTSGAIIGELCWANDPMMKFAGETYLMAILDSLSVNNALITHSIEPKLRGEETDFVRHMLVGNICIPKGTEFDDYKQVICQSLRDGSADIKGGAVFAVRSALEHKWPCKAGDDD